MLKTFIVTLIATLSIGTFGILSVISLLPSEPVQTPTISEVVETPKQVPQDTELLSILNSVGAKHIDDLSIQYGDPQYNARGFYNDGTITIRFSEDKVAVTRTVAHEYLHHVWYKLLTNSERISIATDLNQLLANDSDMQVRVQRYVDRDMLSASELFSIYCTESTDSYMLPVVDECNKYIDRTKLVLTR